MSMYDSEYAIRVANNVRHFIKSNKLITPLTKEELEVYEIFKQFFGEDRVDIQLMAEQFTDHEEDVNAYWYEESWNMYTSTLKESLADMTLEQFTNLLKKSLNVVKKEDHDSYTKVLQSIDTIVKKCNDEDNDNEIVPEDCSLQQFIISSNCEGRLVDFIVQYMIEAPDVRDTIMNYHSAIIVWFPKNKVSNENDESTIIRDTFIRTVLNEEGFMVRGMSPALKRTTFTERELQIGYIHSHVNRLPFSNILGKCNKYNYYKMCTGRGPINKTIDSLTEMSQKRENFDILWTDYCININKIVNIESLKGGPYVRLNCLKFNIEKYNIGDKYIRIDVPDGKFFDVSYTANKYLIAFTQYYLRHCNIRFTKTNGVFTLGENLNDLLIKISNSLIEFTNKIIKSPSKPFSGSMENILRQLFITVIYKDNTFYTTDSDPEVITDIYDFINNNINDKPEDTIAMIFKNKPVKWKILTDNETIEDCKETKLKLLSPRIALLIIHRILRFLNTNIYIKNNEYSTERINPENIIRTF